MEDFPFPIGLFPSLGWFLLFFIVMWVLNIGLISLLSGWQRLAQRYRATQPPTGRTWHWQSGYIGWARYGGVLTLTANAEGLYLEVFRLFGFGHPPLLIPWREFRNARIEHYFFRRQVVAEVGFPKVATVRLPAHVFEETEGRGVVGVQ